MRYVGIDLASAPERTGWAVLVEDPAEVRVEAGRGADDRELLELAAGAERIGIDAPLGWPADFVEFVMTQASHPRAERHDLTSLRFRLTDRHVHDTVGRWPLSVSTDLIGVAAIRCSRLQGQLAEHAGRPASRTGEGLVAEVYPAASLAMWGMPSRGYKRDPEIRRRLVALIAEAMPAGTVLPTSVMIEDDDAFDAVVCALTARSVSLGATIEPQPDQRSRASTEGWIHMPLEGSGPWPIRG